MSKQNASINSHQLSVSTVNSFKSTAKQTIYLKFIDAILSAPNRFPGSEGLIWCSLG